MKTMRELSEYFGIPYHIVSNAMRDIKSFNTHNQKFPTEKARECLLECLEARKARAMEKMAFYDGLIRRVQSAEQNGEATVRTFEQIHNRS